MNRFTAFAVLRLKSDATLEEIKKARFNLLKEGNDNSDGNFIEQVKEAYETILRTQDENIGQPVHYIAGAVSDTHPHVGNAPYKQIVPPYEEAVIKSRIEKLPDRVSCRCCVTGQKFSVEFQFNKHLNGYVFLRPLPYRGEPNLSSVTLPVLRSECAQVNAIETTSGNRHKDLNAYYAGDTNDEYMGLLVHNYSHPTDHEIQSLVADEVPDTYDFDFRTLKADSGEFLDIVAMTNGVGFGHNYACHICGADSYQVCTNCGEVTCHPQLTWPKAWDANLEEKEVTACFSCNTKMRIKNPKFRKPPTPSSKPYDPDRRETVTVYGRTPSGGIEHEDKRKLTSSEPVKRITRK